MPTGDLVLASDAYLAMRVGSWAKQKLYYIQRYCDIFNKAMKARWETRVYIDLFAGAGKCIVEETREEIDGSALTALKSEVPFTHYFFNDAEAEAMGALKERAKLFPLAEVTFFNLDCNQVIEPLLIELPPNALTFCFVDPFNWKIGFTSIEKLTKDRRIDLAITFHSGSMKRVADNAPQDLNDFFGGSGWQQEYRAALSAGQRQSSRGLMDIYESRLRSLGYLQFQDYVLIRNTQRIPLYHILFASKHHRGKDFWDKISKRTTSGQERML
ncbi:MAG: three-Cys-motif partner protein TcmP [Chloroflexota bacterium]